MELGVLGASVLLGVRVSVTVLLLRFLCFFAVLCLLCRVVLLICCAELLVRGLFRSVRQKYRLSVLVCASLCARLADGDRARSELAQEGAGGQLGCGSRRGRQQRHCWCCCCYC